MNIQTAINPASPRIAKMSVTSHLLLRLRELDQQDAAHPVGDLDGLLMR